MPQIVKSENSHIDIHIPDQTHRKNNTRTPNPHGPIHDRGPKSTARSIDNGEWGEEGGKEKKKKHPIIRDQMNRKKKTKVRQSRHEQKKGKNEALFLAPSSHDKMKMGKHIDLGNFMYPTGSPPTHPPYVYAHIR